jgi:hypothetical protein
MTHKRDTSGLKPAKPGQSGNPAGRPKGSTSIPKEFLTNRKHEVAYAIDRQMMANPEEFRAIHANPSATMLERCIGRALQDFLAAPAKNAKLMETLLNHWIGKPKESIDLTSKDGSMSPTVIRIVAKDA